MKKIATAVLGGLAVGTLAFASASALTVNASPIQVGLDGQLYCDVDGVEARWGFESDDNQVYRVRITGIDDACKGAYAYVKTNLMSKATKVLIEGDEVSVSFTPAVAAQDLESLSVVITN